MVCTGMPGFCESARWRTRVGQSRHHERHIAIVAIMNMSLMTHEDPLLIESVLPEENMKTDPRHWPFDIWDNLKSDRVMVHVWPPKERATFTEVKQAMKNCMVNTVQQEITKGCDDVR